MSGLFLLGPTGKAVVTGDVVLAEVFAGRLYHTTGSFLGASLAAAGALIVAAGPAVKTAAR